MELRAVEVVPSRLQGINNGKHLLVMSMTVLLRPLKLL